MRRCELPAVPEVLTADEVEDTARSIAKAQEPSGALPWFQGGHLDPWDHVEAAMGLSAAGFLDAAEAAYEWSLKAQRDDGSWPMQLRAGVVEDEAADTNFCAYLAVGVWHHWLITGDRRFVARMWPVVRAGLDFVLQLQTTRGEIGWARNAHGEAVPDALVSGCASIHHSLRCGLALAGHVGETKPEWEIAVGRLEHVLSRHPEAFVEKRRYSMDWYYPVLGGALRGKPGRERLFQRWSDFVVGGLGARCVDDHPWVTGAETCELVLSLDALGEHEAAREMFAAMQHLRDPEGSYWTGLVYADGKRWPQERTTWTAASVILAADAISRTTPGNGVFRAQGLPVGLPSRCVECEPELAVSV